MRTSIITTIGAIKGRKNNPNNNNATQMLNILSTKTFLFFTNKKLNIRTSMNLHI